MVTKTRKQIDDEHDNKIQNIILEYHPAPQEIQSKPEHYLSQIIREHGFSVEHFPNHFDRRFGLLICRNRRV